MGQESLCGPALPGLLHDTFHHLYLAPSAGFCRDTICGTTRAGCKRKEDTGLGKHRDYGLISD